MDAACRFRLLTPPVEGAIAIIELKGDVYAALTLLGMAPLAVGQASLRDLAGADEGLAVRWSEELVHLMPHGGAAIVRALAVRIENAGVLADSGAARCVSWPEATDDVEALMLRTLARAESDDAVDLLLDQPRRWRAWDGRNPSFDEVCRVSALLDRLVDPPLVAVVGLPNIGKSTLTNALAERPVSIVADEPGTTRDHVGVTLHLAGLAVRWVDMPGLRDADGVEADAIRAAEALIERADLVVLCGDRFTGFPSAGRWGTGARPIRVATRADLGAPVEPVDVVTSAGAPGGDRGIEQLAAAIRARLVPDWAFAWPGPWRFDAHLAPPP